MTGKTRGVLQERAPDLDLMWRMHEALTRGAELDQVLRLVVEGAKPLFAGHAATIYFLDDDRRHLLMQNWALPENLTARIEKLTGLDVRRIPLPLVEGGHYWRVIEERQAWLLDQPEEIQAVMTELASEHPAMRKLVPAIARLLNYRAVLTAPLVTGERVVGVMDLGSRQPLSDVDRQRFQLLASQVGLVIELTRAKERERKRVAWLTLANDIGRRASSTLDLEALLQETVEAIHAQFGYHDVLIALVDHQANELVRGPRAGPYASKAPPGLRKPIDLEKGVLDWVALHGETLLANDVTQEPRYVALFPETQSELCVPIKRGEPVLGVLNIEAVQPAAFDRTDVVAMETLADHLAAAIENARLYNEVMGAKSYLESLVASSIDSIATTDERGILTFWSSGSEKIMGFKAEEALGQPLRKYYVGGVDEARKVMNILTEKGELRDYETWFWHKDGHKVPVSLSASLLKDEEGNVTGTLGVAKDITERKELEEKLSAIYDLSREMVLAMDEEQIAQAVLDVVERVLQVPASALLRVDEERGELQVIARRGYPEDTRGFTLSLQGEGIVAAALAGELVYVPDTRQDQRYLDVGFPGLSDAAVPLKVRDRVIGVLSVESEELDAFDQDDLQLLSALADRAAIAIENARLYGEAQEQSRQVTAINAIVQALNASRDVRDVFQVVVRELKRLIEFDRASIAIKGDEDAQSFTMYALADRPDAPLGEEVTMPLAATAAASDVLAGRPHLTDDLNAELEYPAERILYQAGFRSRVNVPLLLGEEFIGALNLASTRPAAFSQRDLDLLQQVAGALAAALEKARLFDQLQDSEARYRHLVENVHDVIYELDANGIITYCSPSVEPLAGLTPDEVVGRPFTDFIHPDDVPGLLEAFGRALEGKLEPVDVRVRTGDGREGWARSLSRPSLKDGEVLGLTGVVTDITERKQAEEEIRWRAETLAALHETALDLASQRALPDLLQAIVARAVELLHAKGGAIYFYRPATDGLELRLTYNLERDLTGAVLKRGEGLSGKVLETGQPLAVADYSRWEGRAAQYEQADFIACVAVPISWGDRLLGVLNVLDDAPRAFSQADVALLERFTPLAAAALEQARLLKAEQTRRREAETVREAGAAVTSSLSLDETLERILEQLARVVPYDSASVMLVSDDLLRVVAGRGFPDMARTAEVAIPVADDALFQEMVRIRQPVILTDARNDERFRRAGGTDYVRGWIGAPLVVKGRVIGNLTVDSRVSGAYGQEEAGMVAAFANQAAIAIENARLYEETRQRSERLSVVNRIARAASGTLRLDDLLETVYQEISRVFEADAFFLALYDEGTSELDYRVRMDEGVREPPERRPLGLGLTGLVVTSKQPLLIRDFEKEQDGLPQPKVWGTMKVPLSWLGVPMLIGDRVVGVISVQAYRPQAYGEEEELLLSTIADQVAVAVENARLFEAEQRRRQEAETLGEVAQALNQALNLEEMLDIVLRRAMELVGRKEGSIALLDRETNTMRVAASYGLPTEVIEDFNSRPVYADEGTFGIVLQQGQLLEIPDARSDPRVLQDVGHIPEELTNVPLRTEGGVIGVIALDVVPPDDRARRLLLTLSDLASAAIQRAQLFEAERRTAIQLGLINEVGRKVAAFLDFDRLKQEVPRLIQTTFDYYSVGFFLVDEERRELVIQGVAGGFEDMPWEGYRQSIDEGIMGLVVRTGQSWVAGDVSKDPYYIQEFAGEVLTKSEVCVPVKLGDTVVGILDAQSAQLNSFDQDDVVLMEMLADLIAIGVENARLYEDTKRRAEELRLLFQVARDASASLELDEVLESVAAHLCWAAKATSGNIMILDESGERATVRAQYWDPEASALERTPDVGTVYDLTLHPAILQALRENRPVITHVDDPDLEPATRDMMADFDGRSALRLPMRVGGALRGYALIWESRSRHEWTEEEVRLCQALANQAAVAIENARLFADVERAKTEWETTFDAITDYILLVGPDFRIIRANRALAERVDSPLEELIGRNCYEVLSESPAVPDDCPVARAMRTRRPQVAEVEPGILGGIFLASAYPLFDAAGRVRGAVQVLKDISEQKRMQERLLQTEKLAAIGELISGVAHELNNPLAAVLGYAQLLQAAEVSDEVRRDLGKISTQAQRAARIVTNLLDFARERQPEKTLTDVNELLRRTLALKAYELDVENIEVRTDLSPGLPLVGVDRHQMQQVFLNLIINAEYAMWTAHGKGTLHVRTSLVSMEGTAEEGAPGVRDSSSACLRVSIADDGPGISTEIMPRIFDPFFTTKDVGQGTGLGLSIAYGIVTGHEGRIWAASPNEWGGATFYIELPILTDSTREEPSAISYQPAAISRPPSARILVVDDEKVIVELLTRLLRREGCEVDVAREGGEALEKLQEKRYDLIICDVKMPGMSGLEMYRQVQKMDPELVKRITFTTGDTVAPQTRAFLEEIDNPVIEKPFDVQRTLTLVRGLLQA